MAVGDTALLGGLSYVAIGRETTTGTYNTCTAALDCISAGLMTVQEDKIIEQIERTRTYSKSFRQMKMVSGDLSFYYAPRVLACNYLLQNAFFGTITSATATGETVGAGANSAMDHTFNVGNVEQSWPSLCINVRKGDSSGGRVYQYHGLKVNEINFSAEMNEPLKCNVGLHGLDSTQVSNDVSTALTVTSAELLSFVDGRVSVENNFNSLTSSSFWHVQSVQFGWSNGLKTDAASGRIGSAILGVLPLGMASFTLKCKLRFNTTTAYSAMLNATKLSVQLDFRGPTLSSSAIRQGIRFNFPNTQITNSGDPQIGGPNEVLTSDVDFHVLRDDTTSTGYAVQAIVTNATSGWPAA